MEVSRGKITETLKEASSILESAYLSGPLHKPVYTDSAVIVGDTHTAYKVTRSVFSRYLDRAENIVFLGDYVDRGNTGIENLHLILTEYIRNPEKVILLRGNHESEFMNEFYGFKDEVHERLGKEYYHLYSDLFSRLPFAAIVNDYLCVHGGIARNLSSPGQIAELPYKDPRPYNETSFEILWNDPRPGVKGFEQSARGPGTFYFGSDVLESFLENNSLNGLIRGHEAVDGFREDFDGKSITVFSSQYHGKRAGILELAGDSMKKIYLGY